MVWYLDEFLLWLNLGVFWWEGGESGGWMDEHNIQDGLGVTRMGG